MKLRTRILGNTLILACAIAAGIAAAGSIDDSISNSHRSDANRARDGERKPDQVLAFVGAEAGDLVLDWGSGAGYWSELFSGIVGDDGAIFAQLNAGERFDAQKAALTEQYAPFGNIDLLPVERGARIPLADDSVDTVFLSYIFHHMHFAQDSGEEFPASSAAIVAEFFRVLKPGGTFIVIEHAAADGSSRAQSADWHRTPPGMAKTDITSMGFEFAGEAPEIFHNPGDDLKNKWGETGLRGKTTTFVHKYRVPGE